MNGYNGKLLVVDLTSCEITQETLNEEWARQFIGGSGLAARYLYDRVDRDTDPLGPDNPLVFMAGPLVGTIAPACGRHVVCARSPATGLWGEANTGGEFGARMRFAGFDGIIITGQASQPVYLSVIDGHAQLHDATGLWGLDTYTVQDRIKARPGFARTSVTCIGPAGENRVKLAAVMNDEGRAAGRSGLGAVMGSKRLKAVVVGGRGRIPLADEKRFKKIVGDALRELKDDFSVQMLRELGTAGGLEYQHIVGDLPVRYWSAGSFDGADRISGPALAESILVKNGNCYRCPIACWRISRVPDPAAGGRPLHVDGPEYETIAAFGSLILNDDLESIAYAGHLCNAYGLDTISAGATIALAYALYDRGLISLEDTGSLALEWGDPAPLPRLIEMMARREGFGELLAEGSRALARHFGVEGMAVQVNGLEVPMHDPRALSSLALVYATSPRGACHNQGDVYFVDLGRDVPELGIEVSDRFESAGKAATVARCQDWRTLYNSLVMCIFSNPSPTHVVGMLSAATGWEVDLEEAMRIGERAWNLKRAINNRLGLTRANDRLPKALLTPLPDGGSEGHVPDLELMLQEYYAVRGWDATTGRPTPDKLRELGLDHVVDDLWLA
jgi:aldehyde:ferredoxin oxidoreductase